jgi:predicted GIY-YIG superfamily endonuclease
MSLKSKFETKQEALAFEIYFKKLRKKDYIKSKFNTGKSMLG